MRLALLAAGLLLLAHPAAGQSPVPPGATLELLWNEGEFTEGVAVASDGTVYFSDIAIAGKNPGRIMKFVPATRHTMVYVSDSGQSNGLFFDTQGKLLAACGANHGHRALCEVRPDGSMQVLAGTYQGKRFNAPNDLVVHPRGWVYFSDPRYVGSEPLELDHQSVYRYDASGQVHRATTDITKPNGLMLSPDARTLYVAETDNGATGVEPPGTPPRAPRYTLNAFAIQADGSLGPKRVLADFGTDGGIDGMTTDLEGNIYAAFRQPARKGILIFNREGKEIAHIPTEPLPTNCTFGVGPEAHVLYITAGSGLYRIGLKTRGYHPELSSAP
jgi:gluconolactonase